MEGEDKMNLKGTAYLAPRLEFRLIWFGVPSSGFLDRIVSFRSKLLLNDENVKGRFRDWAIMEPLTSRVSRSIVGLQNCN